MLTVFKILLLVPNVEHIALMRMAFVTYVASFWGARIASYSIRLQARSDDIDLKVFHSNFTKLNAIVPSNSAALAQAFGKKRLDRDDDGNRIFIFLRSINLINDSSAAIGAVYIAF